VKNERGNKKERMIGLKCNLNDLIVLIREYGLS
jgi:hypothetical protein